MIRVATSVHERDKIKQMALQFIQNAGEEGTKLDAILAYIKDVLPSTKSLEHLVMRNGFIFFD